MFGHWCQSRKGLGVCNVDNRLIPLKRKNRCSQPKKLLRCWEIRVAASCAYWVIGFFRRVDLGNLWINYINWTMFLLDLWRVTVSSLKQSYFWILLPLVKVLVIDIPQDLLSKNICNFSEIFKPLEEREKKPTGRKAWN